MHLLAARYSPSELGLCARLVQTLQKRAQMPGATVPNVLNFKNVPGFIAFQQIFLLFQKGLIAQILIVYVNA